MAADQELFGAAPLELDPLEIVRSLRRAQVGFGGLGRSSGVGEGMGETFPPRMRAAGCW